jgi:hypothetical protein
MGKVREIPEVTINGRIGTLINTSIPAAAESQPRATMIVPKSRDQLTDLTCSGPRVRAGLPAAVIDDAGRLLEDDLMSRNQAGVQPLR